MGLLKIFSNPRFQGEIEPDEKMFAETSFTMTSTIDQPKDNEAE